MSENWISEVASKLPKKEEEILIKAINDKKIRTAITGVNKETGEILFLPVMIKNRI